MQGNPMGSTLIIGQKNCKFAKILIFIAKLRNYDPSRSFQIAGSALCTNYPSSITDEERLERRRGA